MFVEQVSADLYLNILIVLVLYFCTGINYMDIVL